MLRGAAAVSERGGQTALILQRRRPCLNLKSQRDPRKRALPPERNGTVK